MVERVRLKIKVQSYYTFTCGLFKTIQISNINKVVTKL